MRARIAAMGFAMLASVAHGATPMVAAGNSHAMALHADGTVRTWGDDSRGQLGLGRTLAAPAPAPVVGINDAVQVASGENHVVALRRDGTVVAWGVNRLGQLGDGSTTSRSLPAAVTGLAGITQVSSRGGSSLALRGDGTVWSWGENYNGELGYDEAQLVPQQVDFPRRVRRPSPCRRGARCSR